LDVLLREHGLAREVHEARAGDLLFFSSYVLHSSFKNCEGSADRWALITSYRDASIPDACRVFPHPRPVLREGSAALGRKAAKENESSEEDLMRRYILPGSSVYDEAKKLMQ
jgi:hypothetical protein